jgi:flavin reductase (DIM6/NTAB) family NADH-FMN oxidoreductase RutF
MTEKTIRFRQVLGSFVTGVAIVTTKHEGEYIGLTINSFTSVSLEPTLIQINIAKHTTSHDVIAASGRFAVCILAEDQQLLSTVFAGAPPAERFQHATVWESEQGNPIIEGSLAFLDVKLTAIYDGGDHSIFLAEVLDMRSLREDARPLLYFRGKYGRLAEE